MRSSVVLPTPFGPTTPMRSPGATVTDMSLKTSCPARSRPRLVACKVAAGDEPVEM